MYYAESTLYDGTFHHLVLHIFGSANARDEWVASEPEEPGYGEMWETGEREAITAARARPGAKFLSGIDLHGVREEDLPLWAYYTVTSPCLSLQRNHEEGVNSYWTTSRM